MPGPEQFGRLNIWGMLANLVRNNRIGFFTNAGIPTLSGASATFVNKAGTNSLLFDTTNGGLYVNLGTLSAPLWSPFTGPVPAGTGGVSGGGLGSVGNAKMTYDFATDGGAISTITPANSPTIPANAIILGGTCDITTQLTGAANTTALGLGSGAQAAALKAATAVASYTVGQLAIIPVFTAATYVKVTAATRLTLTIAAGALTAGRMDINVVYVQGNA